jgi:hypothetical protein
MKLKTVKIKGKDYVEVNTRIQYFRSSPQYRGWSLTSEFIEISNERAVIKALIKDHQDRLIASGLAYEKADSTYINKTSYIENCETSAWGRALGNLGIGIDTSVASFEEVSNASDQQEKKRGRPSKITAKQISAGQISELLHRFQSLIPDIDPKRLNKMLNTKFSVERIEELSEAQFEEITEKLKEKQKEKEKEKEWL